MLPSVACERFRGLMRIFDLGDAETFRASMNLAKCVISGSAALYIFHPDAFTPLVLDFYLPETSAPEFKVALYERGYRAIEGEGTTILNPCHTIKTVTRFQKPSLHYTIRLTTTESQNPMTAVVQFNSTTEMNAITADGILCLYPNLTLVGRGIILVDTPRTRRCFSRYRLKGFSFQTQFEAHDCDISGYCRSATRSINDEYVLAIPFTPKSKHATVQKLAPCHWHLGAIVEERDA